jgi:mono/diheme cytochrome c family protein
MLLPRVATLAAAVALATGCGDDDSRGSVNAPAADLPGGESRGTRIISGAGCLACHRIGEAGADGPGPDLTSVGARLSGAEIREVLRDPTPPMPEYSLPPADLAALVGYLSGLR